MPKSSETPDPRSWTSKTSNLGFTVLKVDEQVTRVVRVQRRRVEKATGAITVDEQEREVPRHIWPYFVLGYEPEQT